MDARLRKNLVWVAVAVGAVLAWQAFAPEHPLLGKRAPELVEVIAAGDGAAEHDRVRLSELRGHVVVLDFWATWCPPCRAAIPILSRLARRHERAGVLFYGVNLEPQLSPDALEEADRALGALYPTVVDRTGGLQRAFQVSSLPTVFVVDGSGVVRYVAVGLPDEDTMDAKIQSLIR